MKINRIIRILVRGLLVFMSLSSSAGITLYTNRLDWEAAAGGGVGDITDNFNTGTMVAGVIDRDGYVITGTSMVAFPNANAQTTIDGTGYFRAVLGSTDDYLFTFSNSTYALAYDINPQPSDVGATVNFSLDGSFEGSYNLPSTDVNGFIGFISDTPFTTYEITTPDSSAWHGIDNLEVYSVPEPSSSALALAGLCGIWVFNRRRSKQLTFGRKRS